MVIPCGAACHFMRLACLFAGVCLGLSWVLAKLLTGACQGQRRRFRAKNVPFKAHLGDFKNQSSSMRRGG